jgi:photosystem II stability/assembly factor-like uncharacterized protein
MSRKKKAMILGGAALLSVIGIAGAATAFALASGKAPDRNFDSQSLLLPRPLTSRQAFAPVESTTVPSTTSTTTPTDSNQSSLASISCSSSSDCLAVGNDGSGAPLIEATSNAGSTFVTEEAPTGSAPLVGVDCGGGGTCVAVGAQTIVYSSDDGQSWSSSLNPVAGSSLLGVTCQSTSNCIAVGMQPQAALPDAAVILYSSDGGQSWSQAQTPGWVPAIAAVTCTSSEDCTAVGGSVLTSSDGGQTWSNDPVSGGIQALSTVACESSEDCLALGPNAAGLSHPSAPATGATTGDGGNSWTSVTLPDGTSTAWTLSCAGDFCMVVGPPLSPRSNSVAEVSSDAGNDWASASSISNGVSLRGVDCVSESQCIAVGQSPSGAAANVYSGNGWSESEVVS